MHRFSKLFWITVTGGTLFSTLYNCLLLQGLKTHLAALVALCGKAKSQGCPTSQDLDGWLYCSVAAVALGSLLLFWLAYKLGIRRLAKPAAQAATDAAQ